MTGVDWERLEAFERSWDERLGGEGTRAFRDLFCYFAGKLLASGASEDDIVAYFRGANEEIQHLLKAAPAWAS